MLTKFAEGFIDQTNYRWAKESTNEEKKIKYIKEAFEKFDRLANCLNHIFEQFSINAILTRGGLIPRQDEKISDQIYIPVLQILSNSKWQSVSADLSDMFEDYTNKKYPETITKAHKSMQRFLQILVGEEGKNAQGEVSKLFAKAKSKKLLPVNQFTEPLVNVLKGFISSERANNSTAKPTLKDATATDALLVMNVVMIFLQHCLNNPNPA